VKVRRNPDAKMDLENVKGFENQLFDQSMQICV
jgi:hypothetical protein